MAVDNWKLWIIPFAGWAMFMSWNMGYQSGYQEGHVTAWEMSRPSNDQFLTRNVASIDESAAVAQ